MATDDICQVFTEQTPRAGPNADVPLYCVSDTPSGNDPQCWGLRNATKDYTGKPGATYGSTRPV